MMINIAIFASGSGSNAENIINYFRGNDAISVALILSNSSTAGVLTRAERLGVPYFTFTRAIFEEASLVLEKLEEYNIRFVVLAGFLNKISVPMLAAFPDRIINIHPALLPKYGGKGMYGMNVHEAVIAAGEKESGITIHYINEYYDEGAIILQASCPVLPDDSPEALAARVHELEYTYFPKTIEKIISAS